MRALCISGVKYSKKRTVAFSCMSEWNRISMRYSYLCSLLNNIAIHIRSAQTLIIWNIEEE